MSQRDDYGTNARTARESSRGRHVIARPTLWVIIAVALIGLVVFSYW